MTPALVKRYIFELGSPWLLELCEPQNGNLIATVAVAKVEAAAVFALKYRQKELSLRLYRRLFQMLNEDFTYEYQLITVDADLVDSATKLTQQHKLRGYDAVQLASAITLQQRLMARGLPILQFLASDNDLLNAAQAEGLTVDNPLTTLKRQSGRQDRFTESLSYWPLIIYVRSVSVPPSTLNA